MSRRYLFTGEESYLLSQELEKWTNNFLEKYGPDTVMSLSLREYSPEEIVQIVCSGGLFHENKLIIIADIPGQTTSPKGTAELEQLLINQRGMISQDYFIVFVSPKPDKRKKSYKFFQEHCEVKTFSPMDMRSLPKFLTQEFTAHNTTDQTLTRELIEHIVMLVGKDGWRLSSEIYKLCSSLNAQPQPLTKEFINTIMTPSQEANTFELVDELLRRPSASLLSQIDTLLQSGTQRQAIHGGFLRGIKNILAYGYCIQHGQDTKALGLLPFILGKYNKYQTTIKEHLDSYKKLYQGLIDTEYQIKSGKMDEKGYWLRLKTLLHTEGFFTPN